MTERGKAKETTKSRVRKSALALFSAANYHEILNADFYEHFDFADNLRKDLDEWEKIKIGQILEEGIKNGEFLEIKNMEVILEKFIMVINELEIPFFF